MLTSKQRAFLRGLANTENAIFQIGKGGINENFLKQLDDALEKREIVKVTVLENSLLDPRGVCEAVCDEIGAEPVQVIGKKFIVYKQSRANRHIDVKNMRIIEEKKEPEKEIKKAVKKVYNKVQKKR